MEFTLTEDFLAALDDDHVFTLQHLQGTRAR
jgi:hypothetical protein